MKRLILSLTLLIIVVLPSFGQHHDNVWLMGYNYDQTDDSIEGSYLSFTNGFLEVRSEELLIDLQSSSTSVSSASGELQFYTNGCKIVNGEHQLIENGNEINPGEIYNNYCINDEQPWREYYPGGKQSSLALPKPGADSIYYLFHKAIEIVEDPNQGLIGLTRPMYYSIVDMRENGGLGRVIEKNTILLSEDMFFGQLTAVKHANGEDWWITTPAQENSNGYYRFLFSEEGVSPAMYQEEGAPGTQEGGWAAFSQDGRLYARYHPIEDDLFLFSFDRETGLLGDFEQITIEEEEEWVGSVAFSPSSRYLYVSSFDFIYQYDTWAEDIAASRITIAEYEPLGQLIEQHFWGMQLGPDCRMYVFCNSCDVIHLIHNPDELGLAANFEQGAIQLAWPIFRSQPHFPNYRLCPVGAEGLPCTPVVSRNETILPTVGLRLFPNPASTQITLAPTGVSGQWVLYDGLGHVVRTVVLQAGTQATLDVASLPQGLYFWKVVETGQSGKLIKM